MEISDLYPNRKKYYEKHIKDLENNSKISEQNKKDLKSFSVSLFSTGRTKEYRVGKLLSQLKPISIWLNKDFRKASLDDLQQLIARINSLDRSEATKADYRRTIKQFYLWLEDQDDRLMSNSSDVREPTKKIYRFITKNLSTAFKKEKIDPNEVLNDDNVKQILEKGCKTLQEKAIIMTLHETGMRTSDLLLAKINGFQVDDRGIGTIYTGNGKTGRRAIDIIKSVPYIQEHLKQHPCRCELDKPLFYYIDSRNNKLKIMNHGRFYRLVRGCIENSGISKKFNPHWFRHSRASLDAIDGTMSESVRKRRMGWSDNSKMIADYTHLGQKEVRSAWLRANGLDFDEKKKEEYITCICRRTISSQNSYCPHCGRPTSLEVLEKEKERATKLQEEINEVIPLLPEKPNQRKEFLDVIKMAMNLLNNPKEMKKFEEFRNKSTQQTIFPK
jgi:integrase